MPYSGFSFKAGGGKTPGDSLGKYVHIDKQKLSHLNTELVFLLIAYLIIAYLHLHVFI